MKGAVAVLALQPLLAAAGWPAGQAPQKVSDSFTLTITGTLVKKDGAPAKSSVIAYPLDGKGGAICISTLDEKGTVVSWHPKTETDAAGRFTIDVPHVAEVGKDAVSRVGLGVREPPGGVVTVTVWNVKYADPSRKEEFGMVRRGANVGLLRTAEGVLQIEFAKGPRVDLGTLVVD